MKYFIYWSLFSASWSDSLQHHTSSSLGSSALDDQFSDPAIVSGCLSSDTSNSPPSAQPHWLRSIQQLTENDSSPVKPPVTTQQQVPPLPHTLPFRQPQTHSRMPFAQNIHLNQPGKLLFYFSVRCLDKSPPCYNMDDPTQHCIHEHPQYEYLYMNIVSVVVTTIALSFIISSKPGVRFMNGKGFVEITQSHNATIVMFFSWGWFQLGSV